MTPITETLLSVLLQRYLLRQLFHRIDNFLRSLTLFLKFLRSVFFVRRFTSDGRDTVQVLYYVSGCLKFDSKATYLVDYKLTFLKSGLCEEELEVLSVFRL
jgi:hypothetical protein